MYIDTYEEAMALLKKYPFFTFAAIRAEALTADLDEADRLEALIGLQLGNRIKTAPAADRRERTPAGQADAIDAFLKDFSADTPMQYTPAEPAPADAEGAMQMPQTLPDAPENSLPTEEIARNLIKNRKYADALTIIEQLNLNNPEKSIYFADQIRFLKKLILNQAKS